MIRDHFNLIHNWYFQNHLQWTYITIIIRKSTIKIVEKKQEPCHLFMGPQVSVPHNFFGEPLWASARSMSSKHPVNSYWMTYLESWSFQERNWVDTEEVKSKSKRTTSQIAQLTLIETDTESRRELARRSDFWSVKVWSGITFQESALWFRWVN